MNSKIIVYNQEAKNKLKEGINKIADAVSVTLGPFGRNVLIEKEYGQVSSTKDGVSVAKNIELEDPIENMAATIIKQAAIKTVEQAGDGTTTSTVLARSIAEQSLEATSYPSTNITQMKRGMEEAVKEVVKELKSKSIDITDEGQITQVATLSANGDVEIGNMVAMAMERVGRDGVVTVEESKTGETSLEIVEGIQFDRGYKSPYFVTDQNNMNVVLENPYILIYDQKLTAVKELLPILEKVSMESGKSILIIAEDIEGETLATLVMNKARGVINVCAVKAPDFGDRRIQILEDIATLTGGTVVSKNKGMQLTKFDINWLGTAKTATITRDTTTIVDGKGDPEKIENRIITLKEQLDKSNTPYEIEKLQERLGKMVGGVAIINVGGLTEVEMKEKKDRIDDALQATKSALEEGIVPGAGVALAHARKAITFKKSDNEDFNRGKKIVWKACIQPLEQILNNAGESKFPYLVELEKTKNSKLVPKIGTGKLVDSISEGIIDPTKVVRSALQNALGAAVTLLLTECVIHNKPKENKSDSPMDFM